MEYENLNINGRTMNTAKHPTSRIFNTVDNILQQQFFAQHDDIFANRI